MPDSRRLQLPAAELDDLPQVHAFVRETTRSFALEPAVAADVLLVVEEATSNVIRHGYVGRPGPIDIELSSDDDEVTIRVRDEAPSFDPAGWPEPDLDAPLADRRRGGLGIHLARVICQEMSHRGGADGMGNELTLVLSRSDPAAGAGNLERTEDADR